jgi:tRNA pseudouridine32 synthase/23S rRNA pseudouridine746 synthase
LALEKVISLSNKEIYHDSFILVVMKPAGLLSVPGRGPDKQDCLISRLQVDFPHALVVHRLDQATSGLMVFALNKKIQAQLGRQFEEKRVHKEYEALLEGVLSPEGKIVLRQHLDINNRPYQIIDETGKEGITQWKRLDLINKGEITLSRVRFYPLTGRTHQLRLHARELGAPIVGDTLYGHESPGKERMMLHSCRLEFTHPVSKERVIFLSPPPF